MKKYCAYIALLLSLCLPKANAQKDIDYEDDINPYFIGDSIELIIPKLVNFYESNVYHAATNLQLARIYETRFRESDYLTEFESAIKNAEKAKLLYSRAVTLVDEKEIRKNVWYYPNFADSFKKNGKPILNYDSIQKYIRRGYAEADSFLTYVPPIHKNFMEMVAKYDMATKTFVRINGDYQSIKDIYLLYDQALDNRFEILKNSYDSTLHFHRAYVKAANAYPPFELKQELNYKLIKTYRLDGLVIQTDFFQEEVVLWDYSTWVDELREKISEDIRALRVDINKIQKVLTNSLEKMEGVAIGDSINLDPINKKDIYKIRKYDLNSPVANIFQFKDDKLNLLFEQKSLGRFDTLSAVAPQLKLYALNNLFQKSIDLKDDLSAYQKELTYSDLQKNKAFYEEYYGGTEGVNKYFLGEDQWLEQLMKLTSDSLKEQVVKYHTTNFVRQAIDFKRQQLHFMSPLMEDADDSLNAEVNRVTLSKKNVNGYNYLAGYFFNADSVRKAFLAAESKGEVLWYQIQKPLVKDTKEWQHIGGMALASGGDASYLLYRRNVDSLKFKNSILKISESGKVVNQIQLSMEDQPAFLTGLRNTEEQLAIYQGDGFGQASWPKKIIMVKFHPDSTSYQQREVNINGRFLGMFILDESIIMVADSEDGKSINFTKLDEDFKMTDTKSYQFEADQEMSFVYQISFQSLHVVSAEGIGQIIINDDLELVYSAEEPRTK